MHAAVVRSFDHPPRYESHDLPQPTGDDEASSMYSPWGCTPAVRSDAAGRHYTSTRRLPMIPGVDGVGRLADGQRVYFVTGDDALGSMAERAVVDLRRVIPLPEDVDTLKVAAAMNPAMSSWVALRRRVPLQAGQSILVLGATGNAGLMAVQVAKRLGAGRVIGAGRNPQRLAELRHVGADEVVALSDDPDSSGEGLAAAAAEVDVVIDYLWGQPAATAIMALLKARSDRSRAMDWIQIGAVAGPTIELPSVALRSANLRIQGMARGRCPSRRTWLSCPPWSPRSTPEPSPSRSGPPPLADVEAAWSYLDTTGERIVAHPIGP